MGLFEDLSRFLETRLDEFLRNNPHLELQALEEQLREQEEDTLKLIADWQRQEQQLQEKILETAQEIQRWHERSGKAKAAGREDLLKASQEREASLLRQGNQLWGQMQGIKDRLAKAKELQKQIQIRRQEVHTKAARVSAERAKARAQETAWETTGWNQSYGNIGSANDPLEQVFQRWEADEELERMKRNL